MRKLKLIIGTIMCFGLLSVQTFALTENEVQAQVAAHGKETVTGNILIWFLCAIAFLKVAQKIDTFMSALGINVGKTGDDLLGELMIAFKGAQFVSGGAFGRSSGSVASNNSFLSGGLTGAVGRTAARHAADSVTNRQNHSISQRLYNSSVAKGGGFANAVIGAVAKGSIANQGIIKGKRAAEAMSAYFGYTKKADAPTFSDTEIGGGRIVGKESVGGASPTEFALYNADQYMKPDGNFTVETAADGSKWYKQTAVDTVQKTPYMDSDGKIKYNEEIVQKLPQIPRRKDRV